MKKLRYNIVLQPEPEGGFTVIVPSLPGCVTYGKDIIEARMMAADAIEGWLATVKKHHLDLFIDEDRSPFLADFVEIAST